MKRPYLLIVGAVAAALVIAGVGASANTGLSLSKFVGVHSSTFGDESTGARTETPEPTESPEATETPETEAADNDEQGEDNDDQGENDNEQSTTTTTSGSGEHESGQQTGSSRKDD